MNPLFSIVMLPEALGDLTHIYEYIAERSDEHANRMIERILASIERLK